MSGQHAIVHRLIPGGANVNLADEVTWDLILINAHPGSSGSQLHQRSRSNQGCNLPVMHLAKIHRDA